LIPPYRRGAKSGEGKTEEKRMLEVRQVENGYGKKQVLYGVSIEVKPKEVVALIGPNGAGKSTMLKTVLGLVPVWESDILFEGNSIKGQSPARNVACGITFCPQGNRVFDELTVKENLEIGGFHLPKKEIRERIEEMFAMFPVLKERAKKSAAKLSGGEQQMLAIARGLIPKRRMRMGAADVSNLAGGMSFLGSSLQVSEAN